MNEREKKKDEKGIGKIRKRNRRRTRKDREGPPRELYVHRPLRRLASVMILKAREGGALCVNGEAEVH